MQIWFGWGSRGGGGGMDNDVTRTDRVDVVRLVATRAEPPRWREGEPLAKRLRYLSVGEDRLMEGLQGHLGRGDVVEGDDLLRRRAGELAWQ